MLYYYRKKNMLLSEILIETASTGSIVGHSIAGSRGSLFGGDPLSDIMLKRMTPKGGEILKMNRKKRKVVSGVPVITFSKEDINSEID
jgi:hypothetical protein